MIGWESFRVWWFLLIIGQISGIPYNQPKFCPNATWNASATTFATSVLVGVNPWALFINTNNNIYGGNRASGIVRVWQEESSVPIRNISGNLSTPYSLFVSDSNDIYIDNGQTNFQVNRWLSTSNILVTAMHMCGGCYGLFIDIINNLYCSMNTRHQVIAKSLDDQLNIWNVVAGTGASGATSLTLNAPRGIAVDTSLNLYVTDCSNNRIQRFPFQQLNGTTVVGGTLPGLGALNCPTALAFDADEYLFISDSFNHRILGSGPDGIRCIVGCSGGGAIAIALSFPAAIGFDNSGNLYVMDFGNSRLQRFSLSRNTCGTTAATTVPTVTTANLPTTTSASNSNSNGISYNRPTFSALASWITNGITFANVTTVGATPWGLYVDINNTVYIADRANSRVQLWLEGRTTPTRTIVGGLSSPFSIFATTNGDIYVDNGFAFGRVDRLMMNGTRNSSAMAVKDECYGLFVDVMNNLYCSMFNLHQVLMKSLNINSTIWTIAAGTDCSGSTSNTLNNPRGIFVDTDLNLFVSDCGNDRIQKFLSGQVNAITVAGTGAAGTITLNCPSGVILDGDGYLFIVDSNNHRIVASGPNGFRCLVGCSMSAGSLSGELRFPSDLKFDSYGNIYVTDRDNNRVQKFILMSNTTYPVAIIRPNFCPSTTWYPDATTFADVSVVGSEPYGMFIDRNNTIYVANRQSNRIQIWYNGSVNATRSLAGSLNQPISLYVTLSGDMYVDNGMVNRRVDQWSISGNSSTTAMTVPAECYYIFVDIINNLYCAMMPDHRVVKKWLFDTAIASTTVAGTGSAGSAANMLYWPSGMFVDDDLNVYVGDCGNDRIQMFPLGQMNGITVVGNGAPGTITLSCPNTVIFDANGYMFIGERVNHRIIGSGPYGFRCIAGCTGTAGSGSDQLNNPRQFTFDPYGNIYVVDRLNNRIQKFDLVSNSCSLSYNQPIFCADAAWTATATTFATSATIGLLPFAVFVDGINNVYAPSRVSNVIRVWSQWGTQIRTISANFNRSFSVFVSISGDVYFDDGLANRRVSRSLFNTNTTTTVMNVTGSCYGLFIDLNNYLYCSLKDFHQVVKVLLNSGTTIPTVAAGTGSAGSASNMLNAQQGIYVDNYLNLYIADCGNNRIQLYQSGQTNGMAVAGDGALGTMSLSCPTSVVLDSDGYLFIVDSNNHRIVGSSAFGYRCLVGCSGGGVSLSQLSFPQSMSFDSYGNMYVTDRNNSRIQMFAPRETNCSTPTTVRTSMGPTTSVASTTAPSTTIQTSIGLTTSVSSTTAFPTTVQTSMGLTTSVALTTIPATTEHISMRPTTSLASTTIVLSTGQNLVDHTTSAAITTMPPTTEHIFMVSTTSDALTTAPLSTQPISINPTTSVASTTAALSTDHTSIGPTTSVAMTTGFPTIERSSIGLTTSASLTTAFLTTLQASMDSIISHAPTTTPSTTKHTSMSPTTSIAMTTAALSTDHTSVDPTTSVALTTGPPTIERSSIGRTISITLTTSAIETTAPAIITTSVVENLKLTTTPTTETSITTIAETTGFTSSTASGRQITELNQYTSTPTEQLSTKSTASLTTAQNSNQSCYPPVITLIPGQNILTFPFQFQRGYDLTISSMIELNCDLSLLTITKWTIRNCTSTTCLSPISVDRRIITTRSELYIPPKTLNYGIYELTLMVIMTDTPSMTSSSRVFIEITRTGVIANLLQMGTSIITRGNQQDLLLDPGTYSVDLDEDSFDPSQWNYEYYCRLYGSSDFPQINGVLLTIDDSRIDPNNPSCLSNRSDLIYGNSSASPRSSLIIHGGSLQPNQIYQFMIHIENRRNSSIQSTGYLLVSIQSNDAPLITIGCVISALCGSNGELQHINPTTQLALFSLCLENCFDLESIEWNVYQRSYDSSSNTSQWILFTPMSSYDNLWFFGRQTANFTSTDELFLNNPHIDLWQFEVVYHFSAESGRSAMNFAINKAPANGSCVMDPQNGSTTTLFNISCSNWFDENGIKDYSLYIWTNDEPERTMTAFSMLPTFTVRLPAGDKQNSILHLIIYIRDVFGCVREVNMPSLVIPIDEQAIDRFITSFQTYSIARNKDPLVKLLFSKNQNTVSQIQTSIAQEINRRNTENIGNAISNGIHPIDITVSPLGSSISTQPSIPWSESVLIEYKKHLNSQATIRDYLMNFITNLPITTINSIKLQSATLIQMTESTNQLTRSAATLAIERCYQLALALYSSATSISFDDVQIGSRQIIHCASNVQTAINGPLQGRMVVLDLDLSRSNIEPEDYDTDLESPLAKINSMSETDRNLYYQKESADLVNIYVQKIEYLITLSLNVHLNLDQTFLVNISQTFFTLKVISIESLKNTLIEQNEKAQFEIPSNFTLNTADNSSIVLRSTMNRLAESGSTEVQSNTNLSRSISLSILDQNGNDVIFKTNSVRLIIPRDPNLLLPSMNLQNITSINSTTHNLIFNLHYINITTVLPISVHIEIHPLNDTLAYLFIYKFDATPLLNSSMNSIDGWTLFCPSHLNDQNVYRYFLDNQQTFNHQSLIFGLRELNIHEVVQYCSENASLTQPPIIDEKFNFTSDYELRIYTSGCYYLDGEQNYRSDGLTVGSLTNHYQTECFSTHLTSFAGGFIVLPPPINWSYVFANLDFMRNKTIYLTVIIFSSLYILLMIHARRKDKQDLAKLGVTALADNRSGDHYFYQILVFTGHRMNAGTKSKVYLILSGDENETSVRRLEDPQRQLFQRGGINAFVLAVPKSLGLLNYIRIWHDNSGEGSSASWFLKYIIIRDLQTMNKFYFIAQRWFAVEKDDGQIERTIPVANENEQHEFSYLLAKKTYHSVSDGHLWFSIFSRPPSNRFTRVQRCTCCFVLLFSSMLLNIMYYGLSAEAKSSNQTQSNSLSLGPLYISTQQIVIGIMVELFSLFPSLFIVQFFRRIRSRQQLSPLRQALMKINPSTQIMNSTMDKKKKKSSPFTFPWWCLFIVYFLSFSIMIVSIFFVIVRGIEFGDLKTQQWLTSILTGLFSSILFTQPMTIIALAMFFACFCRNSKDIKEENEYIDDDQIEFDGDDQTNNQKLKNLLHIPQSSKGINRLDKCELAFARDQRMKEIQMWSFIQQLLIHLTFILLICFISFANRGDSSFYQVKHLQSFLLNTRQSNNDFKRISTISEYWKWLETSFVDNIRAQQWYNEDKPRFLNGFLNDKSSRLIGWATMRQLRVKSKACSDQRVISECIEDYSLFNEEKGSFFPRWTNETDGAEYSSSILKSFKYQSNDALDTYYTIGAHGIYSGNGYVYEYRGSLSNVKSNLSELHQLGWIDEKTRAILIQMTLYNPNVQLLTSVTLLGEFLSTGGVFTSARFEPLQFYVFGSLSQLICTIVYMGLIIYFMVQQIRLLLKMKRKYIREFWSWIEVGIIGCSWGMIIVYIWRFRESNRISKIFGETNGYVYVNLQQAVYFNDLLMYLRGFCCFFGIVKLTRLCRISSRLSLFLQTLSNATDELLSFSLMFAIVFISFMSLFHLLFVSKMWSCSDLLSTAQMLFEVTLMKFDPGELLDADAVLGPVCFTLFILITVFICLSVFLTIINENFRRAREQCAEGEEMGSFMIKKLLHLSGLKRRNWEEQDQRMRSQYVDPIENFPDKVDELLQGLTRIYISQKMELSRLEKYRI